MKTGFAFAMAVGLLCLCNRTLAIGGYWKNIEGKAYTVTLTDEGNNVIMGEFKKTVRWEWGKKGQLTITEWDDEATFILKDKNGKEHEIANEAIERRILDLEPGFTGKLQANILEQLLVEGGTAYIRIKEYTVKPLEDAVPKGDEMNLSFGQTIKIVKKKDGLPTMWLVSKEKEKAWIPEYLITANKAEIRFLEMHHRIPETMTFIYNYKDQGIKVWGRVKFRFSLGALVLDGQGLAASADGSFQVALKGNAVLFDESAVKYTWKNPMIFRKGNTTYPVKLACLYYCDEVDDTGEGSFDCIDLIGLTFSKE